MTRNDADLEANEESKLLALNDHRTSSGDGSSIDDSTSRISSTDQNPIDSDRLWEEMSQPWPATFERSISLLSSPMLPMKEIDRFTKSPKPGNTSLATRYRMRFDTPQGRILPTLTRHKSIDGKQIFLDSTKSQNSEDFQATKDNLRASTTPQQQQHKEKLLVPLADTQKRQEQKAKHAAEYRAKILMRHASSCQESGELSPSIGRVKASMKASKENYRENEERRRTRADGKASTAQCAFNLINILMGVGLLGLPYSCAKAGVLGGTVALLTFGVICRKTSIMIGRSLNGDPRPSAYFVDSPWKSPLPPGSVPEARMRKPISSFPDIAREAFGYWGALILAIVLYFELFTCVTIFLVSIGDHLHLLFPQISSQSHMIGCAIVSMVPIVVLRTAKLLSYLSMVGTFATICVVGAVILAYVFEGDLTEEIAEQMDQTAPPPPYHDLYHGEGMAIAFGLVAYCFSGHAIIPSIYNSMAKPQEFEKMVDVSFTVVLLCCVAVGLSGYAMFGNFVADQVTISLEENSSAALAMTILAYLMILTAFSKLTLTMFPLAIGMEELVAPFLSSDDAMIVASAVIKVVLLILALLVGLYFPSFSFLCSMVGMICSMTVSVIFPSAAYLKLFGNQLGIVERLLYIAFAVAGLFMAIYGTIFGL